MARHSDSLVSSVKQAVDIVSLVSDYGFSLHRAGSKYKLLCPFHDDHNPSLELNPERQSFKCWACGAGGDIFTFVQRIERIEFPEALRMLAERAGIALERDAAPKSTPGSTKDELRAVCVWALEQFRTALSVSHSARNYLAERRIENVTAERFQLGFSPDERDWLMRRAGADGIDLGHLETAGLVARNDEGTLTRDRFRGRLIFPILDWHGRPIGFGGRILPSLEQQANEQGYKLAKYINSPETPLFQKRRSLYGLHLARDEARRAGWVAVVEGYTDVLAAHQSGLSNVVGTLGTALGEEHVPLLRRLGERVVLVFDGDEAGQKAAERALEVFLGHEVDARVLVLPPGVDPCDFLMDGGAARFREMVHESVDPLAFALDRSAARFDLASSEGTRQASEWLLGFIARVPSTSRAGLNLKIAKALDLIAQRLHLPIDALQRRLKALRQKSQQAAALRGSLAQDGPSDGAAEPTPAPASPPDPLESELLRVMLHDPSLIGRIAERIPLEQFQHPESRELAAACYALDDSSASPGAFERISASVSDAARSLAAGLMLPRDPQPLSKSVRSTPWTDLLEGALRQWEDRRWRAAVADLERRLAAINRLTNPEEYDSLRRAFLQLNHQPPDSRKTPAS